MRCQAWNHVGNLFPFPSGWRNASGRAYDPFSYLLPHNDLIYVRDVRMSVAYKQFMLSALESGLFLGIVRTARHDAVFNDETNLLTYSNTIPAQLLLPVQRLHMVDSCRLASHVVLSQCLTSILGSMLDTVVKGVISYFPPSRGGDMIGDCPFLECDDIALASNYNVRQMSDGFISRQSFQRQLDEYFDIDDLRFAGMEDISVWPVLAIPNHNTNTCIMLFWHALHSFVSGCFSSMETFFSDFVRSQLSPWQAADGTPGISALTDEMAGRGLGLPPSVSSANSFRLAPVYLAAYAHVLAQIDSQVVSSTALMEIPHHEFEGEYSISVMINYGVDGTITGYSITPYSNVIENIAATRPVNTADYSFSYSDDHPYDEAAGGRKHVVGTLGTSDIPSGVGRREIDPNTGYEYIVLTVAEYMGVVRALAPGVLDEWEVEAGSTSSQAFSLDCTINYVSPYKTHTVPNPDYPGDGQSPTIVYQIQPVSSAREHGESMPCAVASGVLGYPKRTSVVAKCDITGRMGMSGDTPLYNGGAITSSNVQDYGSFVDNSVAATKKLVDEFGEKFGDAFIGNRNMFGTPNAFSPLIEIDTSEIEDMIDAIEITRGVTTPFNYYRFRADIDSGPEASNDGVTWEPPLYNDDPQGIVVEQQAWSATSGGLDGVTCQDWLKMTSHASTCFSGVLTASYNESAGAHLEMMHVGVFEMKMFDEDG